MLSRVVVVAALIVAAMVAAKDGRVMRATGLTATCSVVQQAADGTQLAACRAGRLEGRPDLSSRGCIDAGIAGTIEYWRCPATSKAAYRP